MLFQLPRAKGVLRENRKLSSIYHFIMCVLIFSFHEHTVLDGNVRVKSPVRLEYDILFSVNIISEFKRTQFFLKRTAERMKEAIHTVLGQEWHKEYAEATVAGESIAGKRRGGIQWVDHKSLWKLHINLCSDPALSILSFPLSSSHQRVISEESFLSLSSYFIFSLLFIFYIFLKL